MSDEQRGERGVVAKRSRAGARRAGEHDGQRAAANLTRECLVPILSLTGALGCAMHSGGRFRRASAVDDWRLATGDWTTGAWPPQPRGHEEDTPCQLPGARPARDRLQITALRFGRFGFHMHA